MRLLGQKHLTIPTMRIASSTRVFINQRKSSISVSYQPPPRRWKSTASAPASTSTSVSSNNDDEDDNVVEKPRTAAIKPQVEAKYYVSRAQRALGVCHFEMDPVFKDRLLKISRKCPTRELNYGPEQWERHKDPWRRMRHMLSFFSSSPFRRSLVPDLAITAGVASCLSCYNVFISPLEPLVMSASSITNSTSFAIGLLAAFRLNASYGRYDEARKFWGEINNASRDLAGNSLMWLTDATQKRRMLQLIQAFPVALQFHINEKGGHYRMMRNDENFQEQKYAEIYAELHDIYQDETNPDFIQLTDTYRNGGHVPLAVSSCMRLIIAQNQPTSTTATATTANANTANTADPIYNREMDEQVQRLVGCVGMCERVLRTPIPTCFTRHTSRLFFLWSNLLPFAMYPCLGPIGVIPGSVLVSYTVLAIGDIGVQLEEPFNILPIRQYSEGIYAGINGIQSSYMESEKLNNNNKI